MAREGERPLPPLNLVGDFGGGGMVMAFGMMCGVFEAQRSGRGQVIDAAMVDGASLMMAMFWGMRTIGVWSDRAGTNVLDSGAHYYNVYETADGRHLAVGAIEPQFYAELIDGLGFSADELSPQNDKAQWPEMKRKFAARVKEKSMAEWTAIFDGTDACVAPVRQFDDAPTDAHNSARNSFVRVDGIVQPAPAPASPARSPRSHVARTYPAPAPTRPSALGGFRRTKSTRCVRVVPSVEAAPTTVATCRCHGAGRCRGVVVAPARARQRRGHCWSRHPNDRSRCIDAATRWTQGRRGQRNERQIDDDRSARSRGAHSRAGGDQRQGCQHARRHRHRARVTPRRVRLRCWRSTKAMSPRCCPPPRSTCWCC